MSGEAGVALSVVYVVVVLVAGLGSVGAIVGVFVVLVRRDLKRTRARRLEVRATLQSAKDQTMQAYTNAVVQMCQAAGDTESEDALELARMSQGRKARHPLYLCTACAHEFRQSGASSPDECPKCDDVWVFPATAQVRERWDELVALSRIVGMTGQTAALAKMKLDSTMAKP